jgi:hypothetical protein
MCRASSLREWADRRTVKACAAVAALALLGLCIYLPLPRAASLLASIVGAAPHLLVLLAGWAETRFARLLNRAIDR